MERVTYDLPSSWSWVPLGKVATLLNGRAYKQAELLESGPTPVLRVGNFFSNRSWYYSDLKLPEDKYCDDGDLLYAWSASFGPKIWEGPKVIYHYHIWKILTLPDIEKKFLFYLLEKDSEEIKSQGNGVGMFHATKGGMEKMLVPLPPVREQKRIVEKLDALLTRIDTAIELLQESTVLADALYASSLDKLFEKIYTDYETQPLSTLATKIGSGSTPQGGQKAYKASGISLIRSLNVYDSTFKPKGLAFIDDEQANRLSNVEVISGDVLLNITGASIARCCLAPPSFLPARVNQHVCIIRPNKKIDSQYLNYLLVSPKFKAALLFQGAGGATRQALTKAMISNLEIPAPPMEVQVELVKSVNALGIKHRAIKENIKYKILDLVKLKSSILDSAFKGEI